MLTSHEAVDFLERHFPLAKGADITVRGPVYVQAGSRIYYVKHPAFPVPVALKLCLKPYTETPDTAEAKQQFTALQRVHEKMTLDTGFTVPRPFYASTEEGIVILEWIEGKNMTQLLGELSRTGASKIDLTCRAGAWLRHFHEAHRLPPASMDAEEKLSSLQTEQQQHPITHRQFRSALELLAQLAVSLEDLRLRRSWIHGDFKSDNLIMAGPRTIGIDIYIQHENACIHDLASFLNRLELHCYHPRNWHLLRQRRLLCRTFLESYADGVPPTEEALPLLWLRIYSMLCLWMRVKKRKAQGPAYWYLQQTFSHTLQLLCNEARAYGQRD